MRSLLSLSIAGLLSAPVYATTVTGKVTDTAGQPVAGAEVKIEGSRRVAYTEAMATKPQVSQASSNTIKGHFANDTAYRAFIATHHAAPGMVASRGTKKR